MELGSSVGVDHLDDATIALVVSGVSFSIG